MRRAWRAAWQLPRAARRGRSKFAEDAWGGSSRAQEHRPSARFAFDERAQSRVGRRCELRIVRDDAFGGRSCFTVQREIANEIAQAKCRGARLSSAGKYARSPYF